MHADARNPVALRLGYGKIPEAVNPDYEQAMPDTSVVRLSNGATVRTEHEYTLEHTPNRKRLTNEKATWIRVKTDEDGGLEVHVPEGAHVYASLSGGGAGDCVVRGPGKGFAFRSGSGNGDAVREGDGDGHAGRSGAGDGHAVRAGKGEGGAWRRDGGAGDAVRSGAGEGTALRTNEGAGNAIREGEGDGDAIRQGQGDGDALRKGTGEGVATREGTGMGVGEIVASRDGETSAASPTPVN